MDGLTLLLCGATGTIGQAVAKAASAQGARVICPVRPGSEANLSEGAEALVTTISPQGLAQMYVQCDVVISCLASRTGDPQDAWQIDHATHLGLLEYAHRAKAQRYVQLSAICVQKPHLPFQFAKRAFEDALIRSGIPYAIVRPTAFFKSLSGQLNRLRDGKPFLLFGDGALTACKPISDRDLADYLLRAATDEVLRNQILPIGGPGPALTPRAQGEALFAALGEPPRFRQVPLGLMRGIVSGLSLAGRVSAAAQAKSELARIGYYYATESMLVWNNTMSRYEADKTPETGSDTLGAFYGQLARGEAKVDLGAHSVF
jgi:divinyl chlorophyllide a 8-vinyl-reductase